MSHHLFLTENYCNDIYLGDSFFFGFFFFVDSVRVNQYKLIWNLIQIQFKYSPYGYIKNVSKWFFLILNMEFEGINRIWFLCGSLFSLPCLENVFRSLSVSSLVRLFPMYFSTFTSKIEELKNRDGFLSNVFIYFFL